MPSIIRWKLTCAVLAAATLVTTVAWQRGRGRPDRQAAAGALGLSEEVVIAQVRAARTALAGDPDQQGRGAARSSPSGRGPRS